MNNILGIGSYEKIHGDLLLLVVADSESCTKVYPQVRERGHGTLDSSSAAQTQGFASLSP
jgi:hypothetical protein